MGDFRILIQTLTKIPKIPKNALPYSGSKETKTGTSQPEQALTKTRQDTPCNAMIVLERSGGSSTIPLDRTVPWSIDRLRQL